MLRKYIIERHIPGAGAMTEAQLGSASVTSNGALAKLDGIQWQYSFLTADGTVCIYLAESEDLIREHARLSGFPANRITEAVAMFDPSTEQKCPSMVARVA